MTTTTITNFRKNVYSMVVQIPAERRSHSEMSGVSIPE